MSTSAPLLCSGKQQTIKKRREKKETKKSRKQEIWFMVKLINYQNLKHQKKGKNSLVLVY